MAVAGYAVPTRTIEQHCASHLDCAARAGISPPTTALPRNTPRLLRWAYLILAVLCGVVGLAGVLAPGLPATPFFLLTSYFLARSWPRLHERLLASALVGPILSDWQRDRCVRPRVKVQAMLCIVGGVVLTNCCSGATGFTRAAATLLAMIGLAVIYCLPNAPRRLDRKPA